MLNSAEIHICVVVFVGAMLAGFMPKLLRLHERHKKKSALKKSKQHFQNINDYDYDEELYGLELELLEIEQTKRTDRRPDDSQAKPKVNFIMNALSLVIGFQSTISIIGMPVEFYYYGFKSIQLTLSILVGPVLIAVFFVPFVYKIKSNSIYEYLDDKFNNSKSVKYFTLFMVISFQFMFASLVLYSASITILQIVSFSYDVSLWQVAVFLGALSTCLAFLGLKSVVWANFLQYLIMIACNISVIILGLKHFDGNRSNSLMEGASLIWNITESSGRGDVFVFAENFRARYTFWNSLGLTLNVIPTYCLTQQSYMRIKQADSMKSAKWLVLSIIPFGFLNMLLIILLGCVMFAYFYKCGDPLTNGAVKNQNQLFSQFLTQFYAKYTGLIGFYIALLLSGAVSTISSCLKGLSVNKI